MITKIICALLLVVTVVLHLKHFWDGIHIEESPQALKMITELQISKNYLVLFGITTLLIPILVVFPQTYFISNLLNALTIVLIMSLALRVGNYKIAFLEIPFLIIPFVMIFLKYPFKS